LVEIQEPCHTRLAGIGRQPHFHFLCARVGRLVPTAPFPSTWRGACWVEFRHLALSVSVNSIKSCGRSLPAAPGALPATAQAPQPANDNTRRRRRRSGQALPRTRRPLPHADQPDQRPGMRDRRAHRGTCPSAADSAPATPTPATTAPRRYRSGQATARDTASAAPETANSTPLSTASPSLKRTTTSPHASTSSNDATPAPPRPSRSAPSNGASPTSSTAPYSATLDIGASGRDPG
jgi:hypothetical protein